MTPVVILGAGGLGREVLAALQAAGEPVAGFLVEPGQPAAPVHGLPVVTDPGALGPARFVVAVGDPRTRQRLVAWLGAVAFATVRHPAAVLGPGVELGEGAMLIGPMSATCDLRVGAHALVNPGCALAHDTAVGAYAALGPRVALAGGAVVEEGASLGTGAIVAPRCRIGAWAVVGAGAAVIADVPAAARVAGVPARPLG